MFFFGKLSDKYAMHSSSLGLSSQIACFAKHEKEAIKNPHENLYHIGKTYPGKLSMLAFAYASLYVLLLENVTSSISNTKLRPYNSEILNFLTNFERNGALKDYPFASKDGSFEIENKFGSLRFVSCGSKRNRTFSVFRVYISF